MEAFPPETAPVPFSLATWNINSVRLRIDSVVRFLNEQAPDALCLQETKCPDANFPAGAFRDAGYEHIALNGQKGYHGVAIVSRHPFADVDRRDFCDKGDSRHIAVTLDGKFGGVEIHDFYVPAGGDEPDVKANPKFAHKLDFVDEMGAWFQRAPKAKGKAILVGDLNIAPLEHDVWSHKALLNVVSHTPVEVEKFTRAQKAGKWYDALRHFVPPEEKLYTWWSYRSPDWAAADKGRRLDHVWVSPPLADTVRKMRVHRDARAWDRPSDHAPVTVELAI
ncbi:MAG: exodeoxyribonuclease III [Pseudomonadota bacterium]|nr:exodeoxyribonuclease III [Pseudomonadota bacterium]